MESATIVACAPGTIPIPSLDILGFEGVARFGLIQFHWLSWGDFGVQTASLRLVSVGVGCFALSILGGCGRPSATPDKPAAPGPAATAPQAAAPKAAEPKTAAPKQRSPLPPRRRRTPGLVSTAPKAIIVPAKPAC